MEGGVVLASGAAVARLYPDHGGRLGQLEVDGRPLLRGPEDAHLGWGWWGSYPLIPWSNRIPDGRFRFRGAERQVPVTWTDGSALHGLGVHHPWQVRSSGETTAELTVDLAVGPYSIEGTQVFSLDDDGLTQVLTAHNRGDAAVPAGLGIHPWFHAGPVRVPADRMWPGDGPMPDGPPVPVGPDEDLRSPRLPPVMDRCYTGLTGTDVEVPGIRLSWSGPVTHVVVFTGAAGWVCVEPVTMANDGFRLLEDGVAGSGVVVLEPGEPLSVQYRFAWT